jgi:hypothetical protein
VIVLPTSTGWRMTGTSTDTAVAGCRVDQSPPIRRLVANDSKQGVDGKIG